MNTYAPVKEWTFPENDSEVVVELERWFWVVLYADGSELAQFDSNGRFHQFKEINMEEVARFTMVCSEDTDKQFSIEIGANLKPFHFYRNTVLKATTADELRLKTYAFGYQDIRTGNSMYFYILPDDRLIITENKDFNPVSQEI